MAISFYRLLLQEFPDWKNSVRFSDDRTIKLVVAQPDGRRELSVAAGGKQISIYYGDWHFCIGTYLGWTEERTALDVIRMMKDIVAEEQVAHITLKNGKPGTNSLTHNCVPVDAKDDEIVNVYSWQGTYDRIVKGPAKESWKAD